MTRLKAKEYKRFEDIKKTRDDVKTATSVHYSVGKEVRTAIENIY